MKISVVGAGIMGLATAHALQRRGHSVTVYEQFSPGHENGSSHGNSRIVRKAYPESFYTEIMADAYPLWQEFQRRFETQILFECGLLYFGERDSKNLADVLAGLEGVDEPYELVEAGRFAGPCLDRNQVGIFTPRAGWVHAAQVMACLRDSVHEIRYDPADLVHCDRYVLCPGRWISDWVPELPVTPSKQVYGYFELESPLEGPVWIHDSPELFYGFPSEPGSSKVKVGYHAPGATEAEQQASLLMEAQRRFGHARGASLHECWYTNTPDRDFRWGHHQDRGFWLSACSGHGFKFAPWLGEKMADFVEEKDEPERTPRFCSGTER